jgi:hypothetical protein
VKGAILHGEGIGGLYERQPQPLSGASKAVNLTVDQRTMGWTTRVGYESYRVDPLVGFAPYASTDRIDSLFVFQEQPGSMRHVILFESAGVLYLQHESGGTVEIHALATGRAVPSASTTASQYTIVAGGALVTNGFDAPVFIRPWPLVTPSSGKSNCIRPFGAPSAGPPSAFRIRAIQQGDVTAHPAGTTSLWVAQHTRSMPSWTADQFGLGFARNKAGSPSSTTRSNEYAWQVSYVTDTGSEGLLSSPTKLEWETEGDSRYRYACMLEVPPGPLGTSARRIYRSRNYSDDTNIENQSERYFVYELTNNAESLVLDGYQTASLGALAPQAASLVAFPASTARFATMFNGRCWLDGGYGDPRTVYYSALGKPEQFDATGYLTLRGDAGNITGLYPYYGVLLVWREDGVDAIIPNDSGGFRVLPITKGVQCVAPDSADEVPDAGVMFAASDGVYLMSGAVADGAVVNVQRISDNIMDTWSRVTQECLPRAVGRYSPLTREYHLYVPADGDDRPSLGLVWHVDKASWTIREGFPVGSLDRLPTGNLVFGVNSPATEKGLFVISSRRATGRRQTGDNSYADGPAPVSRWKSPWLSMTSPQAKKQVQYVTLWVQTTGTVPVTVRVYKDWERVFYSERSYEAQPADAVQMPVLDTVTLDSGAEWERLQAVPLRVAVAVQSCSWFSFEIETSDDLTLVGWSVDYQERGTMTIEGRRM